MISPGSTTGLSELASSLMLSTATPRSWATLLRLKSLVTILPDSARASSISFRSTSRTSGKSRSEIITSMPRHLLHLLQDVEPATAAVALHRVRRVGDQLQFLEHELRDHQRAVEKAGLADVGHAAVDDHAGVEDAVAALGAGAAEQADQARRLEPFALAAAQHQPEVRQGEQHERVEERDAVVLGVGPEERRADGLGDAQADRAAQHRAEHVRDRRVPEPRLERDKHDGQRHAEGGVELYRPAERPQQDRGIDDGNDEEQTGKEEPGHANAPE